VRREPTQSSFQPRALLKSFAPLRDDRRRRRPSVTGDDSPSTERPGGGLAD
jgi:hypothetical protein